MPTSGNIQTQTPLSGRQKLLSRLGSKLPSYSSAPAVGTQEGVNKAVVCIAPSWDVPKSINMAAISPLLMNIAQSSSSVRCRPGEGPPSNGQPNVKRQKLDEGANPTAAGTSASTAIAIDNVVEGDEDDNGIEILEDEDDGKDGAAIVAVDAQGNATTSTPSTVNITGGSTFTPWVLMDLHPDVIADIKGKNRKKILNQLRRQYYHLDAAWVRCLHLQLPQEPCHNRNINDMMEYMLKEWRSNRFMQQYIFSVASIHAVMEGKFSSKFINIMERAHSNEKFQSARGWHEREFEFDYLFHCFFDTNGKAFPNDHNCILGVMCS